MQKVDCGSMKKPSQEVSIAEKVLNVSDEIIRYMDTLVKKCGEKLTPIIVSPFPPSLVNKEDDLEKEYPPYFLSLNKNLDKIHSNLKIIEGIFDRVAF